MTKGLMTKKSLAILTTLLVVVVIGLLIAGFSGQFSGFSFTGSGMEQKVKISGDAGGCALAPSLSLSAVNAFNKGTAVTTGIAYSVNDAPFTFTAPSSYAIGSKVKVLLNASNYVTTLVDVGVVPCGAQPMTLEIPAYSAPTIKISDDSYNVLTDSATGGAVNGSKTASGGTKTFKVKFSGVNQKTSGNLVYVIETSSTQNITNDNIRMYTSTGASLNRATVPTFYTQSITGSRVVAFEVPEVIGSAEVEYTLSLSASNSKVVQGAVYTTAYVKNYFIDTDGSAKFGVENADGTDKSLANFDYDIFLK